MKTYLLKVTFTWDDGNDSLLVSLSVPENTTLDDIPSILHEEHDFLDSGEYEECLYENNGRNAESLLSYVCEKCGWSWEESKEDMEVVLD